MSLNPQQFFHGSGRTLQGDTLLPANKFGDANYDYNESEFDNHGNMRRGDYVYAGTSEAQGWEWASHGMASRKRVHIVEPVGDVEPDGIIERAVRMPAARVKDTLWTPPFSGWHARYSPDSDANVKHIVTSGDPQRDDPLTLRGHTQGTLPPYNWNQQRHPNSSLAVQHARALEDRFEDDDEPSRAVHPNQATLFGKQAGHRR